MAEITHKIRFSANATDALAEIGKYGDKINEVGRTADAMADKLGGGKLIQSAHNWVAAVDKIGGVTKLTATEQARINNTLDEAIQKYKALGVTAPSAMTDLYNKTKQVHPELDTAHKKTSLMGEAMGKLGPMVVAAFSIGAIKSFASSLLDTADGLMKMSAKTGISTDELQNLRAAAIAGGNTLEDVTAAINKMQVGLAGESKGVVQGLKALGLSLDDLRGMDPAEQFETIATAIQKVEDPADRAKLRVLLFGKAGNEVAGTLAVDFKAIKGGAVLMADGTVRAFDDAGDKLDQLKVNVSAAMANAMVATYNFIKKLTDGVIVGVMAMRVMVLQNLADLADTSAKFNLIPGMGAKLRQNADEWKAATQVAKDTLGLFITKIGEEEDALRKSVAAKRAGSKAVLDLGDDTKKTGASVDKLTAAVDEMSGKALKDAATETLRVFEAFKKLNPVMEPTSAAAYKISQAFETLGLTINEMPLDTTGALFDQLLASSEPLIPAWADLGAKGIALNGVMLPLGESSGDVTDELLRQEEGARKTEVALEGLSGALDVLAASTSGATAEMAALASSMVQGFASGGPWAAMLAGVTSFIGLMQQAAGEAAAEAEKIEALSAAYLDLYQSMARAGMAMDEFDAGLSVAEIESSIAALRRQQEEYDKVAAAAERYGLELSELSGYQFTAVGAVAVASLLSDWEALLGVAEDIGKMDQAALTAWFAGGTTTAGPNAHVFAAMAADIDALVAQYDAAGVAIPADLQLMYDQLNMMDEMSGGLIRHQVAVDKLIATYATSADIAQSAEEAGMAFEQMVQSGEYGMSELTAAWDDWQAKLGNTVPKFADITAAADRYGLSVDSLGPRIQQIGANETFAQMIADFDMLTKLGANVNTVLGLTGDTARGFTVNAGGMADQTQELFEQTLAFGGSLPETMRPIIEAMIATGTLTDATGAKITDIGAIRFEETPMDRMIASLNALITTLGGTLPAAVGTATTALTGIAAATVPTVTDTAAAFDDLATQAVVAATVINNDGFGAITDGANLLNSNIKRGLGATLEEELAAMAATGVGEIQRWIGEIPTELPIGFDIAAFPDIEVPNVTIPTRWGNPGPTPTPTPNPNADNENGYAGGTYGQFLDFGAGTPVTLHGRERVMTEAEGWREARVQGQKVDMSGVERKLDMLLSVLPTAMARATRDAMAVSR